MPIKHKDLHFYVAAERIRKHELATRLGVSRYQLSGLLYPDRYPVVLSDDLAKRIAELLNQSVTYVRSELYPKAAAA